MELPDDQGYTLLGICVTIGLTLFGWIQARVNSIYKVIDNLRKEQMDYTNKTTANVLYQIKDLKTVFENHKSDTEKFQREVFSKMITRQEIREDLKELKSDLKEDLRANLRAIVTKQS